MNPIRGRAKRGVKLYQETSGKRTKKDNVIAGYLKGTSKNSIDKTAEIWYNKANKKAGGNE